MFKKRREDHVVIIGNGIAGITCAIELRKLDKRRRITVISGETAQFFSRPALMYIYMGHMKLEDTQPYEPWFWKKKKIELRQRWVTRIDTETKQVHFAGDGGAIGYDQLVVATGSKPNKFGWKGQDLDHVQGLYDLQDLNRLESISHLIKRGVIIGGGLIGVELAEMLHARGKHATILAREDTYWSNILPDEESRMVTKHIIDSGIDLRCGRSVTEIVGDEDGKVCAVTTDKGERIDCQFAGLTAGVRPNLSALEGSNIETGRGVLVDAQFRTSVDGVYAIGDCAEIKTPEGERNRFEQLWYTGKMHGQVLARQLAGEAVCYERGIWFNSAKFVDLEWHTYGFVPAGRTPSPEGTRQAVWTKTDRQGMHLFRLVVDGEGAVIGMNGLGLRHRHRIWHGWIQEQRSADYVLEHLRDANFDPEFFRKYEGEIRSSLKGQFS